MQSEDVALIIALAVATLVGAALMTGWVRRLAVAQRIFDEPNARSSHVTPTPRGGGAAIVVCTSAAFAALGLIGIIGAESLVALMGGSLVVALAGYLDDQGNLPPRVRIAVHVVAALWALGWSDGLPPIAIGQHVVSLGWVGYVLGVLGIVWALNLFNFMDGIDGIAAAEGAFVAWSGAAIALLMGTSLDVPSASLVFGAACCGFLFWNWPPAKIFMGDVGSGYAGYVVAALALAAAREDPVALIIWAILGGVFFVDATVTLVRRALRGEAVYVAHRLHGYQRLARRWNSHRRVTVAVTVVNVLWLLPCAFLAAAYPQSAVLIFVLALAPIAVAAFLVGSGLPDQERV